MPKICVEVMPSLAETLGIASASEQVIENEDERTVRDLLVILGHRYQRFARMVFDDNNQKLTGRVSIFLNGHALELIKGLDTRLSDGDTLTFVPLIEGG